MAPLKLQLLQLLYWQLLNIQDPVSVFIIHSLIREPWQSFLHHLITWWPLVKVTSLYAPALKLSPITPSELSSSSIHFHPPSKLLNTFICIKTSLLHTIPLSVHFHFLFPNFWQFCRFLERMKTDDAKPPKFGRPLCPVCMYYALCSSVSGTGPLKAVWISFSAMVWWYGSNPLKPARV